MNAKDKKNLKKVILSLAAALLSLALIFSAANCGRIERLYRAMTLFDHDVIADNFRSMWRRFDARTINRGNYTFSFKRSDRELPGYYTYKGSRKSTSAFIESTETTGFIVIRDDTILYEKYYRGNAESSKAISWSVGKSFVSALFGIAVSEGYIKSIEQKVTDYLPQLAPCGYRDVRIKDVLQMSSGIGFNEDYASFNSDINRLGRSFALNTPIEEFILTLKQERKPGTFNHYVSMDTQVLGMIICAATGKNLSRYIEEKLWRPMGMESEAYWLIDSTGMEIAFGGLNITLRDYARFGRLYLNRGNWNGEQIVPESWVKASITPDAPHLMPGRRPGSDYPMGYGFQWWIPENPRGDFMAIGVYGQAIYINPEHRIVIVKTSAYSDWTEHMEETEDEEVEMFRAIAREI